MKSERWKRLRALYEAALERAPETRDAWLAQACDDPELRAEVRGMVAASDETRDGDGRAAFLDPLTPAAGTAARPALARTLSSGTRVGSFELGQPLARGGMGTVYEAWQDEPRRKVALKLLHAGLSGSSAVRRFRFEAELLARLRHPGIATVLEAGVHADGDGHETPYLAMEYVEDAADIVAYANRRGLDLRARLALFGEVCAAVQHGHQHGIVHRDLKPQNILVDGDGRVRVIDFGIARATGEAGRAPGAPEPETRLTGAGEILGTLGYMSPEQFRPDALAIDTRSDVYSLGVVLHELACGRPPFELAGLSIFEIARVVGEEPARLPTEVPTDLGWVIVKALAKAPEERYASASELAADIERFLDDAPVEAGAPSSSYRLKKFVRRNRVAVICAALAVLALIVGAAGAIVGLVEAEAAQRELAGERDVARAAARRFESISDVLASLFTSVTPDQVGREVRVADVLDRASVELGTIDEPAVAGALRRVVGRAYASLGLRAEALHELELARASFAAAPEADARERFGARADLARALAALGRVDEALALVDESRADAEAALASDDPARFELALAAAVAHALRGDHERVHERLAATVPRAEAALGPAEPLTLELRREWARSLWELGRAGEARELAEESAARASEALGPTAVPTLDARYVAALQLKPLGRTEDGLAELEALLPTFEQAFGRSSARTCKLLGRIAEHAMDVGRFEESYALLAEALPCLEATLDPTSPDLLTARGNLAAVLDRLGDDAGALSVRRAAFETARRLFGPDDERTLAHAIGVAIQLVKEGRPAEAHELAGHVADVRTERHGADDPDTLEAREVEGSALMSLQRPAEALPIQRDVFERLTRTLGPEHPRTLRVHNELMNALAYLGRLDEAMQEGERLLAVHRRALPADDPSRLVLLANLGWQAYELGQLDLARDYLGQAYEQAREHLAADDPNRWYAVLDQAQILRIAGEHDACLPIYAEAIDALRSQPASNPEMRARAHGGRGASLLALGRPDEARTELERAATFASRGQDPDLESWIAQVVAQLPAD